MDLRFVYITAQDEAEAETIGRALVEERLAACVNLISGMRSMYWWDGQVQRGDEWVLIAKTRADRMPALIDRVRALHGYEVPCIVGLPISEGNPDFLDWIGRESDADGGA